MYKQTSYILLLAIFIMVCIPFIMNGQSEIIWSNTYGGAEDESFQDVFITSQDNAQTIGFGQSTDGNLRSDNGLYDILISELNSNGNISRSTSIGGSKNDLGKSILIHEERTFIGGLSYSVDKDIARNLGGGDILFASLNNELRLQSSTLLGGNNLDNIIGVKMMQDGSIVIVGNTNSTDLNQSGVGGATDVYVCRLLPEGIVLWEKTFGSDRVDKVSDVVINSQDEIVIVGSTFSDDFVGYRKGIKDGFVMCINNLGDEIWGRRFGNGNYASFVACDVDNKDNILITGVQGQVNPDISGIQGIYNEDIMVLKLDNRGEDVWRRTQGGQEDDLATDIISTLDGGVLVIGATKSFDGIVFSNFGDRDAFVLKLDKDGQKEWSKGYGGSLDDILNSVAQDKFGQYWLVGQTTSSDIHLPENHGGVDAWVLKLKGKAPSLTVNLGAPLVVCEGEVVQLDASIAGCDCEYIWSDGFDGAVRSFEVVGSRTLSVNVSDEAGNVASDDITITVNRNPVFELVAENPTCANESNGQITASLLSSNEALVYTWSINNPGNSEILSELTSGEYSLVITDQNNCSSEQSIALSDPAILTLDASVSNTECENLEGQIVAKVTGGTAPYQYIWSNGASNSTLVGVGAGEFHLTVTDNNGCNITRSYIIDQEEVDFDLEFDISNNTCSGLDEAQITVLNASEISEFDWSTGGSEASISNLAAGEYTLNYITQIGCSGTQSFTISEPDALAAETVVNDNICGDAKDGRIELIIDGGTPPYIMAWSNGESTPLIDELEAGNYSVTINDDNGCAIILEEVISAPISIVLESANVSSQVCEDIEEGMISVNISGGTGELIFAWSNGASTPSISNLAPGLYELSVTDELNCTQIFDFLVDEAIALPELNVTQSDPSCTGDANGLVELSAVDGISYTWPDGFIGNERDDLPAGEYEITVANSSGCTDLILVSLSEPEELDMFYILENASCFGLSDASIEVLTTGGTEPYTLTVENTASQIFDVTSTQSLEGIPAGLYFISLLDDNGCALSSPLVLTEPDSIIIEAEVFDVSCFGDRDGQITALVSGGTGEYTYDWGTGENSSTIQNLPGGTFLLEVVDENNCLAFETYDVLEPTPIQVLPAFTAPSQANNDGVISLILSGGLPPYTVNWSDGVEGSQRSELEAGTYEYTVLDANNCIISDSIVLEGPNSIRTPNKLEEVTIFPNPVNQVLFIDVKINYANLKLSLYNTLGQEVYGSHFDRYSIGRHPVPVQQLASGIYYLSLSNDSNAGIYKVVVEHP